MSSIQNSEAAQQLSNGQHAVFAHGSFNEPSTNSLPGPVAQNVKDQANKTSSEFQNLADSRTTPAQPAATGQPLTHYHSMFYNLLSWRNPRASAIAFLGTITLIFTARYLDILRYGLKLSIYVLGATASFEVVGRAIFDNGIASRIRPRRYYTIPRESLERSLEDVEQLLNFFVIESQRIVFAENIPTTIAAFLAAVLSYWLIKIVPFWGLCVIGTCVLYLTPLIYVNNKQLIDSQLDQASTVVNKQLGQVKQVTAQQTGRATATMKSMASEYTTKAQSMMGNTTSTNEHTLKPSAVAGSHSTSSLPTPPTAEPGASSHLAGAVTETPVAQPAV